MHLIAPLAALLLAALPLRAAEVTTFTLDNGMDVVVLEDARAPVVVHMVWYRVGAADEPPGASGIAHFLEHLMFKGTETLGPGEFSALVEAQGGSDNAFTAQDYTGYFQRVAADRLDLMMEIEADRMTNLALDPALVATERDVILEERNQRIENSPGAVFAEQRNAAQYLAHPYRIPVIGWEHEMRELTREDALAFYDEHYAPNNAILIVAGDVTPDEVRSLAEAHYEPIPANPDIAERARPQEPPQRAPRRLTYEDPRVAQPYVIRTYLAPERDAGAQEEAAALTLLAELLGGDGPTPLMKRVLEIEESTALYAAAFYNGTSLDDTTFGLVVVPTPERTLAEAEADMDRMIARFLEESVDDAALERLKMQVRAQEIYARDDLQGLARRYGVALTSGLTVEDVEAWPRVLDSVTEDDIMAAARALFDPRRSVTGYLRAPEPDETAEVAPVPGASSAEVTQ
ncbi:MAG: pitrilysin family protein [Paracoccaceae bacterium]|jgi:zinc protease|nr:pitrilysin family protein [Paracoccaceae bacterium]